MSNVVTLRNGAKARVLPNGQYRFVSGASPEYLDQIRATGIRGPNKRPSGRPVSQAYLLRKLKADKNYNVRAIKSDMAKKSKRVLDPSKPHDAKIIRKAGSLNRYDVLGFDDGSKAAKGLKMRRSNVRAYKGQPNM